MVKQKKHMRKIGSKLVLSGKGKKNYLIGKLVRYKEKVYIVVGMNPDKTYHLRSLTPRLEVNNVPRSKIRLY